MRVRASSVAAVVLSILGVWLTVGVGPARADTPPITLDVNLSLRSDGALAVTTTTTVPDGATATGRIPLAIPVEANRTQHFQISDITADNGATASIQGAVLVINAPAGTSKVSYSVRGTVADGPDLQQFTWVLSAGWSAPISTLTGSFSSPSAKPDSPICAYGQIGVRRLCSLTQTAANGSVEFQNNKLGANEVALFSVLLPAQTVTATADFTPTVNAGEKDDATDVAGIIAVTTAAIVALLMAALAWLRRRADDAAPQSAANAIQLLTADNAFASPDGVRPGQIGSVTTSRPRPSDISATVLDLAVRHYLWIAERPTSTGVLDFQISRRTPLDGGVTDFERAVVDALLPNNRESVSVLALTQSDQPAELMSARWAITASVGDWVRKRGQRVEVAGYALLLAGAVAAVVVPQPLWGVAVAVFGGGLAAAGRLLPDRTARGSRLAAAIASTRRYLTTVNPESVPPPAQSVLLHRGIPYAHSLGELQQWLKRWPNPGTADWYRTAGEHPLPAGLPTLAALLDGIAAQSEAARR
ncbi:hypothetical protein BOO86_17310 [Mycobacterium sp. CBMA 234]|uniref:DUF2207 family protein n=1 Tax=Mycolicibacterium sp. CBMA 234 TaxID=1918495 RepID=UPI0012DD357D|nr:DUF2207 domain-containing protein [Mycolicibacterium sp. CBMA 234]MUL66233.1 hypothetical protein [Mycolicibacterium sp. CBMA 234]